MQDSFCKDGSGLQFIKFDFVAGGQEVKIAVRVEFCFSSLFYRAKQKLRFGDKMQD